MRRRAGRCRSVGCRTRSSFGCNEPRIGAYVARVLGRFALSQAIEGAKTYDVQDLGPSETSGRYRLQIDGKWVLGSGDPSHILDNLFSHVNVDTVEATRDRVLVHAGAVVAPSGKGCCSRRHRARARPRLVAGLVRAAAQSFSRHESKDDVCHEPDDHVQRRR
jgi:hypothetical protein